MLYIKEIIAAFILAIVVVGNLGDVLYDYREGASIAHILMELSIAIVSFALITALIVGIWKQSRSNNRVSTYCWCQAYYAMDISLSNSTTF